MVLAHPHHSPIPPSRVQGTVLEDLIKSNSATSSNAKSSQKKAAATGNSGASAAVGGGGGGAHQGNKSSGKSSGKSTSTSQQSTTHGRSGGSKAVSTISKPKSTALENRTNSGTKRAREEVPSPVHSVAAIQGRSISYSVIANKTKSLLEAAKRRREADSEVCRCLCVYICACLWIRYARIMR